MRWRCALVVLALTTGCYSWQSASYQRPPPVADTCFAACRTRGDAAAVFACARECPGVVVEDHACTKDPQDPCVAERHLDTGRTVRAVFVITLVTLLGALVIGGLALAGGST